MSDVTMDYPGFTSWRDPYTRELPAIVTSVARWKWMLAPDDDELVQRGTNHTPQPRPTSGPAVQRVQVGDVPKPVPSAPTIPSQIDRMPGSLTGTRSYWLLAAAARAREIYPGPAGDLLHRELLAAGELCQRLHFGNSDSVALLHRVADQVME